MTASTRAGARRAASWAGLTALALEVGGLSAPAAADEALRGFVQANYSLRVVEADGAAREGDLLLGDERVQLEIARMSPSGRAGSRAKVDLYRDAVDDRSGVDLREAYTTVSWGRARLRAGRQVLTWGTGDLVFIADVFPKDWTALIAGRPLEYLKLGSDAVTLDLYLDALSAELVVVPFFQADSLPQGRRLAAYDPFAGTPQHLRLPAREPGNAELALRLHRYLGAFETAGYLYRGRWRFPAGARQRDGAVTRFYPELTVYAASLRGSIAAGVAYLEAGWYDSRLDRAGTDPEVENSQVRLLAGYQRASGPDLTVGVQYYGEGLADRGAYRSRLPAGLPLRQGVRHSFTARLTRLFDYQTVRLSLFAWASPDEEDFYVNSEVRYSLTDEMSIAAGVNGFGGSRAHTFFGQYDANDNAYATLRYAL